MNKTAPIGQPGHSATPRFDTLGLSPELLKALTDLEFTTPTPVQVQAIPAAIAKVILLPIHHARVPYAGAKRR